MSEDNTISDHNPQRFKQPERPVMPSINGQDPSTDTPLQSQPRSEAMLSTTRTAQPNGRRDVIHDRLKCTKDVAGMEQEPMMSPGTKIDDFGWEDLEQRYRNAMEQKGVQEQILHQEFEKLMQYFAVWVGTTPLYESERSLKRLKTRICHVQNSEEQLEEKRIHYEKVVTAFQSALELLNGP